MSILNLFLPATKTTKEYEEKIMKCQAALETHASFRKKSASYLEEASWQVLVEDFADLCATHLRWRGMPEYKAKETRGKIIRRVRECDAVDANNSGVTVDENGRAYIEVGGRVATVDPEDESGGEY